MAGARLLFEERKAALKWYFKFENISEVQRQRWNEFGTQPPTRLTIARIWDKFEIDGNVGDVHKERSGRPRTATTLATSAAVLKQFTRSPQKSVKQCSHETGVSRSSVQPLDFYLWGSLKDDVYWRKPATLDDLRENIAMSCAAITLDTLQNVVHAAVRRLRQCLDTDGGHFEHLHWIQNSRTSLISILLLYKYSNYDYRVIFFMSKCVYIFLGHSVYIYVSPSGLSLTLCFAFNRRTAPITLITSCSSFSNSMSLHCSHCKTQCHISVKNSKLYNCQRIHLYFVTSDVLTGVLPYVQVFWDVTICWLTNDDCCFEGL